MRPRGLVPPKPLAVELKIQAIDDKLNQMEDYEHIVVGLVGLIGPRFVD